MHRPFRWDLLFSLVLLSARSVAETSPPTVRPIVPPERGFFSKRLDYRGIPIKAPAVVADSALQEAWRRLAQMLDRMPNAVANLTQAGAELHIIGKDQGTSDLPEHRHLKGKPYDGSQTIDERTRGVGGLLASCGEENLLRLPKDRYRGRDICVHEFAHTLFDYGFSPDLRDKIKTRYLLALEQGFWKTAYASTNENEFFAEMTMWYFGTHGDVRGLNPAPEPGRDGLLRYDPETFALVDSLYSGRLPVKRLPVPLKLTPLPASRAPSLRSRASDRATTIRFRNRTVGELRLYWLDEAGMHKPYGSIAPGEEQGQNTFAGHAWMLADADGKVLALFVAADKPAIAEVRGSK